MPARAWRRGSRIRTWKERAKGPDCSHGYSRGFCVLGVHLGSSCRKAAFEPLGDALMELASAPSTVLGALWAFPQGELSSRGRWLPARGGRQRPDLGRVQAEVRLQPPVRDA